jgi:hypothetical protein
VPVVERGLGEGRRILGEDRPPRRQQVVDVVGDQQAPPVQGEEGRLVY